MPPALRRRGAHPQQQVEITTKANDQAAAAVAANPKRFAAFATLPMSDPKAAAAEFTPTAEELGLTGAMINGRSDGRFLDHPDLFVVLQTAERLGVPIYLHPSFPSRAVFDEYYSNIAPEIGFTLATTAWGWHSEVGLHVLRVICAGVFDRLPNLQLIIGHMGEMIPFMIDRIETWLTPRALDAGVKRTVAQTFRSNVWLTTSGMFASAPLELLLQTVGADRVLFSVDYPYSTVAEGRRLLDQAPISPADLAKISYLNAERLLHLPEA